MLSHHRPLLFTAVLAATTLLGCAGAVPDVPPIRLSELTGPPKLPMVIEFREGDRLALEAGIGGDLVTVEPAAQQPTVVVKRRFFLVLGNDGPPRISFDGKTFAPIRGGFMAGVGTQKDKGPKVTLRLDLSERR